MGTQFFPFSIRFKRCIIFPKPISCLTAKALHPVYDFLMRWVCSCQDVSCKGLSPIRRHDLPYENPTAQDASRPGSDENLHSFNHPFSPSPRLEADASQRPLSISVAQSRIDIGQSDRTKSSCLHLFCCTKKAPRMGCL